MTDLWVAILLVALGGFALKASGYFLPERVLENERMSRIGRLVPVSLLAALTAVQVFASGQSLTLDARAAGLAFAVVALLFRAPFLVVVVGAAVVAALLRAVGG